MIGTVNINVAAAQPQKPTTPLFSFRGSPSSIRVLDCPKQIGKWAVTRVYIDVLYPDNTTKEVDCVRTGNVWVGTFEGSTVAGKVTQGYQIKADGVDENENAVSGYVLSCGDVYILDDTNDIKALVGKTALRMLDDIPAAPAKGDVVIVNGALKIYDGEEWYDVEADLSDYYTKEEIDSSLGELSSSISELANDVETVSASVSAMGTDLSTVTASVSSLTSSMTSLASTKRDKTDRVWKYTRTTDPEMYGVQKFQVTNDTISEYNELVDFNKQTKTWSVYEGTVSVVAYSNTLFAVIDQNNPHQFDDDGEMRNGWPFYRTSDTINSWTIGAGEYEYSVRATPRADTSFALDNAVAEKRDYDDLTWDYPLEQDSDRFGVGNFNVDLNGSLFNLTQFSKTSESRTWSQLDAGTQGRFEIYTSDGRHYNLLDKVDAKTMPFTRTGNDNVVWSIETNNNAYVVRAIRREQGRLAIYEPDISDPDQVVLDFGQSSAGLVLGTNLTASTQAFLTLDDVTLTGTNYVSSRAATMRGATKRDVAEPHLKVNGETVPFTREVEATTSQLTSEIGTVTASVSAMASTVEAIGSSVSGLTSSVSALGSSVSAMASTVESVSTDVSALGSQVSAMASTVEANASAISANTSSISAIVSSLSSYATTSYVNENAKTVWRTWEYEPDGLKFRAEEANSTVGMQSGGPSVSIEYTTDGTTWNDFIVGTTTVTLPNIGDKMWMRAKTTNNGFGSISGSNRFVMTGKIAASGSIMYLLKNDGDLGTIPSNYCFFYLFSGCTSLTTAPELPATTLGSRCYYGMFEGCTSLTEAPELPATTLAQNCYYSMFNRCSSLTKAPYLPATTLVNYCYNNMFRSCSSLNEIKIAYTGNFSGTGVPTNAFNTWVSGVASTGTFYYNGSDTTRGDSAIPANWSVQTF